MRGKLTSAGNEGMVSPLVDILFNSMAAMFLFLIIYICVARPTKKLRPEKLAIVTDVLPVAEWYHPYDAAIVVRGGMAPYTFALEGAGVDGLSFDTATGRLLGNPRPNGQNPTAPASFRLRVSVTDVAERDSASKEVELPVAPAAVPFDHTTDPLRIQTPPGVLSRGYVGHEYGFTPGILGGIEPYTSSVDLDPASGLQWDASLHKLTGIPEKPGRVRFTLTVTDQQDTYGVLKAQGNEVAARADYEIAIERLEIHVEASLPVGRVAEAYRGAAAMRGGLPPYTVEASLPEGLEIDPAQGIVTGKPEKEGLFPVEIRVKDSVGKTASLTETLRVLKPIPKLRIVTEALAPGTAGSKYDQRIAHEGGTAPLTWRITTDASFPASLSTLENGIQGVPERECSGAKIKVEATDALGETASREYTLDVFPKKRPLRQAYDPGK